MATKFYNVEKVAEILEVPAAEVNQLRETRQLRGLRDGADWKFKAEEVEMLAAKRKGANSDVGSGIDSGLKIDEDLDVLLGDVEVGSGPSASGTVIGPPPEDGGDDTDQVDSAVAGFEDLDLSIEASGLELASGGVNLDDGENDSGIELDTLGDPAKEPSGHVSTGASSILGLADEDLDDDNLVLGGESGIGSDSKSEKGSAITLGGESGISLLDPADSGISLEEPLDLSGSDSGSQGSGSGADSLLSLVDDEGSVAESSSDLSSEGDDFMLSSMEEDEEDDSSQVIALEEGGSAGSGIGDSLLDLGSSSPSLSGLGSQIGVGEGGDEEVVDLTEGLDTGSGIGSGSLGSGPIDFGEADGSSFESFGDGSDDQAAPSDFTAATATGPAVAAVSEGGYTKVDYLLLYSSFFTLGLVGILMYDLVRNMWLWDQAMGVNSWLIELIFG